MEWRSVQKFQKITFRGPPELEKQVFNYFLRPKMAKIGILRDGKYVLKDQHIPIFIYLMYFFIFKMYFKEYTQCSSESKKYIFPEIFKSC